VSVAIRRLLRIGTGTAIASRLAMNQVLSTTAWVLHDLGLATSFGGSLFGKAGLHPAIRGIADKRERGEVVSSAWQRFSGFNALALAAIGLPWLIGRQELTGREVDSTTRGLVVAKDALVGITVASGLGSMIGGFALSRQDHGGPPPLESGGEPSRETPEQAAKLQRAVDALGYVSLAGSAALIGLTAVLAIRSGKSTKWSFVSRFLP
jgi:hypothetical protein